MQKCLIFNSKEEAEKIIPVNTIRKIQLDGKQYCLANNSNNFIAFQKECPHAGADLSKGTLNTFGQIVCPFHAYMFDLKSGEEDRKRCKFIKIYTVFWEENKLYISIN